MKPSPIRLALAFAGALTAACALGDPPAPEVGPVLDETQTRRWQRLWEEQQAVALLVELSGRWRDGDTPRLVEGATVVPMTGRGPLPDHSVLVAGDRIRRVAPAAELAPAEKVERIDARGLFLIPGLVDSHSHTISSPSQFLVYLTRGVTTLREMDGFAWMLQARDRAARGELLIPSLFVSGHILSHRPSDFYMTGVDSADQARELVRRQAAAGYDFIKIHNSMPEPLFSAVFETAREAGLDVAGHIPIEIPIADAIAAGLRTAEHFKGYLYDETLEITDQDYVAATRGSELWHTPTFTTYHEHLRGPESRELAQKEGSLALVPRWMRAMWRRNASAEVDRLTALRQTIYPKSRRLFADIRPVTDRFLAGTDTGTYGYLVPGFALQEEIRIFEDLGMTPAEALATATVNPARAFRREEVFGTLEPGKRADFVLLEKNPLESSSHLSAIAAVSVRGVWLDRDRLDEIEERLSALFSEATPIPEPTRQALAAFVEETRELAAAGWPVAGYTLEGVEELLREVGLDELADRLGG